MTDEKDRNDERWECGPHTNAWGGHDARCRRIPVSEKDLISETHRIAVQVWLDHRKVREIDAEGLIAEAVKGMAQALAELKFADAWTTALDVLSILTERSIPPGVPTGAES